MQTLPLDHHLSPWNRLYCFFSCRVWTRLHGLSFKIFYPAPPPTHLSSSLSSFGNKATWKKHFQVWFISYITTWNNMRGTGEKGHFRGRERTTFYKSESFSTEWCFIHFWNMSAIWCNFQPILNSSEWQRKLQEIVHNIVGWCLFRKYGRSRRYKRSRPQQRQHNVTYCQQTQEQSIRN